MTTLTPKQEEIAVRAYHLYLEGGCQHGRDLEYWFQAEKDLGSRFFSPPDATKPAARPTAKAAKKPAAKKTAEGTTKKTAAKKAAAAPAKKPAKKKD